MNDARNGSLSYEEMKIVCYVREFVFYNKGNRKLFDVFQILEKKQSDIVENGSEVEQLEIYYLEYCLYYLCV